jgi:penicillin amidase
LPIPEFLQERLMLGEPGSEAARGSNNWVVAGDHTTTGAPLLANDPHLDFQMPSLWYLAHLHGERIHVTGPTFPGLPGFPIGHNEHLAWGLTNVGPDVQDLVIEHLDPDDPLRVEYAGAFEPVTVRDEVIRVKGRKDVELRVRETRHGPIVTEYYDGVGEEVALRWTALADDDSTVVAFSELVYASTVDEGLEAMRSYVAPAQNIVLADRDGHIGWLAAGRYPLRSDGGDGNLPVPGWDRAHEWTGWLPFEDWPRAVDPERGWFATANARTVGPDYPHYLGDDFSAPYRTQRIVDRLSAGVPLDGAEMAAIQRDVVSLLAVELLPTLRGAADRAELSVVVDGWDGSMDADSAAAALFQA